MSDKPCEYMRITKEGIYCTAEKNDAGGDAWCTKAYFCGACGGRWRLQRGHALRCERREKRTHDDRQ